ncbi:Hypothetical protein A7982_08136 [Minicystis rosea]|nr:Hypothetical protein A7982_08136 [Minicystis rosea]
MSKLSSTLDDAERRRVIAAEQARVRRIADRFLAQERSLERHPTGAAIVYLHEAIHFDRAAEGPSATPVGRLLTSASEGARRRVLLAVLDALARSPELASTWEVNVISDVRFVHDHHWGPLVKALLRTRATVDEALLVAILERLSLLANRFDSKYPKSSYPFPFSTIVRFVQKHASALPPAAVAPAAQALLDSIERAVSNDLVTMKGYKKAEARTLAERPGEWFAKTDRAAIDIIQSLAAAAQSHAAPDVS